MSEQEATTRREFIRKVGAVAAAGVQASRQSELLFFDRRKEKVTNRPVVT